MKTIIGKPQPQPLADQPGRYGVEDLPQRKGARRCHRDDRFLIIAGPLPGQWLQNRALNVDVLGNARILAADDLVDEAAIIGKPGKGAGAAHQQRIPDRTFSSEERRVGKECGSTLRSRWSPIHEKKKMT